MDVEINWLAIVSATVVAMVVGAIWHSKPVFGKQWQRLVGLTDKDLEKNGWAPIVLAIPVTFVTAYVLAHVAYISFSFFDVSFLSAALQTAFWAWLGFSLTTLVMHNAFEGKDKKLTVLNGAYQLVLFLTIGFVIGLFGVS